VRAAKGEVDGKISLRTDQNARFGVVCSHG
jgi:hypothetical protein